MGLEEAIQYVNNKAAITGTHLTVVHVINTESDYAFLQFFRKYVKYQVLHLIGNTAVH